MVTPSVVVAKIPAAVLPSTPATLPVKGEDSLKFSFEAASDVGEGSGDGPSLESMPIDTIL